MTSEQKELVYNIQNSIIKAIVNINAEQMWELIEKAFEQKIEKKPCEDCISREQALKVIEKEKQGWEGSERYAIDECHTRITELPSVTPTRPKGKWKRISPAGIYECTNCNQVIMTSDIDCYKFCHGCGVRMEGKE